MADISFVYVLNDPKSNSDFTLVGSEVEIKLSPKSKKSVVVYKLLSEKSKPTQFSPSNRSITIKVSDIISLVDSDLYKYAAKAKTFTFTKKSYEQLKQELQSDESESEEEEEEEEVEEEEAPKGKKATSAKGKAAPAQKGKASAKSAAMASKIKSKAAAKEESAESQSEQEEEEEEEEEKPKPAPRARGRAKKVVEANPEEEEDEEDEEESEKPQRKTRGGSAIRSGSVIRSGSAIRTASAIRASSKIVDAKPAAKKPISRQASKIKAKESSEDEEEQSEKEESESAPPKKKGKANKSSAPAKGRKSKKASKVDEEEEEDDENDEKDEVENEESADEAPKKGKKAKVETKFKKGVFNPNVTSVIKSDEVFEGTSSEIADACCSFCTNHELIRAVKTGNHALLKKLVNSKSKVSTLFAKRGPDSDMTTLETILKNKDKKAMDIFIEALQKKKDLNLAPNPECSLDDVDTGHNDRFAYGVPTRKVNLSRGGKEGNNAFVSDLNAFVETNSWQKNQRLIVSLLENETEIQFLDFLRGLENEEITKALLEKIYIAVRAGNRKTAGHLLEVAAKIGGYGFNKVHEQVLTLNDPEKMDEFRKVSATKKSQGTYASNEYGYGSAQGIITPIHCAAINPNPDFIKKLLDIAPEFTIADDMLRKPIHYAAACEGPGPLSYLIKQGVDTREGDKKKITPLMIACQFGRAKNVEILLEANSKSNPDARTRDGMRAIHYAAYNGHLDCVKLMLEKGGVQIDSPGAKRMTPLHMAAARGYQDLVEYLLEKGSKQTLKDKFKKSAIIHATANGHIKILSILLKKGGLYNDPDSSNNYPVHYAAAYGFQSSLELLKQAGADFNPKNDWNLTPLSVAMAKGHFGMVKKLLNYPECDVNCTDVEGRTIISRATEKLSSRTIGQFEFILKEKKANPNMSDNKEQSPLHFICRLTSEQYIAKRQKEEGKYTLTKKFEEEYNSIVEKAIGILIECGANINKTNYLEQTPLSIAIVHSNFHILKILIKHGGLNFGFKNQIDQNIFHGLSNLVMSGPEGIQSFHIVFDEIKKDTSLNYSEMLNQVDYNGYTPILTYLREFSQTRASQYREKIFNQIKQEIFEKKGGVKSEGQQQYKSHKMAAFGNDGSLVQVTEQELQEAHIKADAKLVEFEQEFLKLIKFLESQGANIQATVQKIKKYRSKMDVEKEIKVINKSIEESGEEKECSTDEDSEDEEDDQKYDPWGNPIVQEIKFFKEEYTIHGEYNILHFAIRHSSLSFLKFIFENYPELAKGVDYLGRNAVKNFVVRSPQTNLSKNVENQPASILTWLCSLPINLNQTDLAEETPLLSSIILKKEDFAKILIQNGAILQVRDFFGNTPLISAIKNIQSNNLDFVQYLLEKGADPNYTDLNERTSLHYAVDRAEKGSNASFDLENLLISHKADYNAKDKLGRTPLHYAFVKINQNTYSKDQYDPFETVSSLCNQTQIKIDEKDNLGKTPLHYASQKNSTISAIYLVEKGASIETEDIYGNTPLSIAFRFKRSEITTNFIQKKADTSKLIHIHKPAEQQKKPNENNGSNSRSRGYVNFGNRFLNARGDSSHYYAHNAAGQKSIFETLLASEKFEVDSQLSTMNQKAKIEKNPLPPLSFDEFQEKGYLPIGVHSYFKAAIQYQWQGIAYLLLMQSNYNLFNALEDAINVDLYQLSITLLAKYPSDLTVRNVNKNNQNLIHILSKRPSKDQNLQIKLLESLLTRGVDPKQVDSNNNLCLHFCPNVEHLVKKFLNLGLDCNLLNKDQNTPFSLSIQRNATLALDLYRDIYKPNISQNFLAKPYGFNESIIYTPFVFLIANKCKDLTLLQKLIHLGADVNEVDGLQRNSLYYAIYHNSVKVVQFLIQTKKLNVNQVDTFGKNAVHYVVNPLEFGSYENTEILQILKQAGYDLNHKDNEGNTPLHYALLQDTQVMANKLKSLGVSQQKEKQLPKRAPTSIVASADFPEEEVDFDEDSKIFAEDPKYDQFKEYFELRNGTDKIKLDKNVAQAYQKPENYVVLDDNNEPYNLLMTKVDLGSGGYPKYVFYIMQIIFDKNSGVFILFTRWGHISTVGQMQHTPYPTKEAAVKEFSKIFSSKSGNEWVDRKDFKKQDKKYQIVQFDSKNNKRGFSVKPYDLNTLVTKPSTLDEPIYNFVKQISNAEIFKTAIRQLAVSESYLPLTQLSKTVLLQAQNILSDLAELQKEITELRSKLTSGNNLEILLEKLEEIVKLSNRYYELVPRATSKWEPAQPLENIYNIQNEQRLIENLLDFEAAIKIIMGSFTHIQIQHPLDYCYNALNIRMKSVTSVHPEFKMIQQYISRTNKAVLEKDGKIIKNIFAVERRGEAERIKQFTGQQKKLLWHGSGVQNFLSILSFGLRINGIQANRSGSSLGDGIYFSDLYSKASGYANNQTLDVTSQFLLLCEVAVGKEQQIKTHQHIQSYAKHNHQLMKGYNSIKLVGKECPDEKKNLILSNGTIVPIGPIVDFNEELKKKLASQKGEKYHKLASGTTGGPLFGGGIFGGPRKQMAVRAARRSVFPGTQPEEEEQEIIEAIIEEEKMKVYDSESDGEDIVVDQVSSLEAKIAKPPKQTKMSEEEEEDDDDEDDGENNENDDEEEELSQAPIDIFGNNIISDKNEKRIPFNEQQTQFGQSEYVVFNPAQVRVRYLIEINQTEI